LPAQLERRLELLRRLSAALVRGRAAIVARNLDGILETTAEQQSLCAELRRLLAQMAAHPGAQVRTASTGTPTALLLAVAPADVPSRADLSRPLRQAQQELRFNARVNQTLLQRCRVVTAALSRLYMSCSGTYTNPYAAAYPAAERR
jgi:hypothetical protein